MAVRAKAGEDLSETKVAEVIEKLESDKPITKKTACAMLGIAYNTTRLQKIIDQHNDMLSSRAARRKAMRGKPITQAERKSIIENYMLGEALTAISNTSGRSVAVVKNTIEASGLPLRDPNASYQNPYFIDDRFLKDNYKKDDLIFSARYGTVAYIEERVSTTGFGGIYRLYVLTEDGGTFFAYQPWYDLADLRDIQNKLGIAPKAMEGLEVKLLIQEGLVKANKKMKK